MLMLQRHAEPRTFEAGPQALHVFMCLCLCPMVCEDEPGQQEGVSSTLRLPDVA